MKKHAVREHLEKGKYYEATFGCDCGGGHSNWKAIVRVDALDENSPATGELTIVDSDEPVVQAGFKFPIYEHNDRFCYGPLRDPITFSTVSDGATAEEESQPDQTVAASRYHTLYGSRQDHNPVLGFEDLLQKYSATEVEHNPKTYPYTAEGQGGERHIIRSPEEEPHPEDVRATYTAGLLPKEPCPKCGGQLVTVVHPFEGVECVNKQVGGCDYEHHDEPEETDNIKQPPERHALSDAFHVGYTIEDDNDGNTGDSDPGSALPDPRYAVGTEGAMPAEQSAITEDVGNVNGNNDGTYPKGAPRGGSRRIRREAKPKGLRNVNKPRQKAPVVWDPSYNTPSNTRTKEWKQPNNRWELGKPEEAEEANPNEYRMKNPEAPKPSTDVVPYKAPGLPQVTNPPANPQQPQQQTPFPTAPAPAPAPPGKKPGVKKPGPSVFQQLGEGVNTHEDLVRKTPGPYRPPYASKAARVIRRSAGPKRIVPKNPSDSAEPNPAVTEEHSLIPAAPTKGKTWKERSLLPGHERGMHKDPNDKIPRKRKALSSVQEAANWFPSGKGNVFTPRDESDKLTVDEATGPEATGNDPVDTRSAARAPFDDVMSGPEEDAHYNQQRVLQHVNEKHVHPNDRLFDSGTDINELHDFHNQDHIDRADESVADPENVVDHPAHTAAYVDTKVCEQCGNVSDPDDDDGTTFDSDDDTCSACGGHLTSNSDIENSPEGDDEQPESEEPQEPSRLPSMASKTGMTMEAFFNDDSSSDADDEEYHHFMMANMQSLIATGQPSVPMTTMGPEWAIDEEPTNDDGSYGRPRVTSSVQDADLFL